MEALVGHGVERILINTHYLAPLVQRYLEKSTWMPWVTLVYEASLLGTGGTLLGNREFFGDGPMLVAHADNLTIFDTGDFMRSHASRPTNTLMTMMVFEADDPKSCGIVELDGRGVVQAFHEKVAVPPGNLANAAVYIFESMVFDMLESQGKSEIDLSTEIIPHLMGRINTYKTARYHRDIGTIASWREANKSFPLMPATAQNALAWMDVRASIGGELDHVLNRLLTGS